MSEQYPGGYLTKSPVVPDGSTAPGIWTLSQQAQYQAAGSWPPPPPTSGVPYVWGSNFNYGLGVGGKSDWGGSNVTMDTAKLATWNIATGTFNRCTDAGYTILIKQDGTMWGYGANGYGQLGNNTVAATTLNGTNQLLKLNSVSTWAMVSGSQYSTLATRTDGTLWAWGTNGYGQIGDLTVVDRSSPVQVGTSTNWSTADVKKLAGAGAGTSYAIKTDNTLWSWGRNVYGLLGANIATTTNYSSPVQVGTDQAWKQVSGGSDHVLAVKTDGTLWSWGRNNNGQLGQSTVISRSSPVQVGTDTTWSYVTAVSGSSFAIKTDNTLWAWGYNAVGQLGTNNTIYRSSPVQVGSDYAAVYGAWIAGVAVIFVKTDGTTQVVGQGVQFFVSGATPTTRSSPIQVGSLNTIGVSATSITYPDGKGSGTGYSSLAVTSNTGVSASVVFGAGGTVPIYNNPYAPSPILYETTTNWSQISMGGFNGFGVKSDGTLWVWGNGGNGQLGNSTTTVYTSPVQSGASTNWSRICGNYVSVAGIRTDGTLWTWGDNTVGGLGLNSVVSYSSPVQVGSDTTWKQVSGYSQSTSTTSFSATKTDGTLWAWGYNGYGQLGQSNVVNRSSPVQIGAGTTWSKVVMGYNFCVALKTDGTLWAWGNNSWGQLGQSNTADKSSPVQVGAGTTWYDVAADYGGIWATKTDGTLWAWGYNDAGQLGLSSVTRRSSPTQVGTLTNWKSVGGGYFNLVATKADGTMWASGQYPGDGSATRSSPVQVSSGATNGTKNWGLLAQTGNNDQYGGTSMGAIKA